MQKFDNTKKIVCIRGSWTEQELHDAFDSVKNSDNWKMPINKIVNAKDLPVVCDAIEFFCGPGIDTKRSSYGKVRVTHPGYYIVIGA